MLFYNKEILWRIRFLSFFFIKKKRLGYKKVQWKISSFFHSRRTKNIYFFINKLTLYKRFFYLFFIEKLVINLFNLIKKYYIILNIKKKNLLENFLISNKLETSNYILDINDFKNINLEYRLNDFFFIFFNNFLIKLLVFMLKSINISYIGLPIKRNIYTILRSPHINKKAREQFELKHFIILLNELSCLSLLNNPFLFNYIKFFISDFKLEEKFYNHNILINI